MDIDTGVQQISGIVTILKAADESDITHYNLYWGSDSSTKLKGYSAITRLAATGTNLTHLFPNHTDLPAKATHLLVFSSNRKKEMISGISTGIKDHSHPVADLDCFRQNRSTISLKNKKEKKSNPDRYEIYFEDDATIVVTHKKNTILSASYGFWGANWEWANSDIRVTRRKPTEIGFSGKRNRSGISINGTIKNSGKNILKIEYVIDASHDLSDPGGVGIQFDLQTSPNTSNKALPGLVILPDNRGWKWEFEDGEAIQFLSSRSTDAYFEKGESWYDKIIFYPEYDNSGCKNQLFISD